MKDLRVKLIVSHEGSLTNIIKDIIARGYRMKSVHIKELSQELQELNFIVFIDRKYASEVYEELKSMPYIEMAEVETL